MAQVLGVTEKLWIMVSIPCHAVCIGELLIVVFQQTWGEAYEQNSPTFALYNLWSFVPYEPEIHHKHLSFHHANSLESIFTMSKNNTFGLDLPNAIEYPLFYIGVYAIIGLTVALAGVVSVVAQYTGAWRASRILFKWVLSWSGWSMLKKE